LEVELEGASIMIVDDVDDEIVTDNVGISERVQVLVRGGTDI
jgi:hypothetical protein